MKLASTILVSAVLSILAACGGRPSPTSPASTTGISDDALRIAGDDPHRGDGHEEDDRDKDDHRRKHDECLRPADFDEVTQWMQARLDIGRPGVCAVRRTETALAASEARGMSGSRRPSTWT
jgi:hypothetical protein